MCLGYAASSARFPANLSTVRVFMDKEDMVVTERKLRIDTCRQP